MAFAHVRSQNGLLQGGKSKSTHAGLDLAIANFVMKFFSAWIVVSLIYLWFTLIVGGIYPLFDGGYRKIRTVLGGRRETKEVSGNIQQDVSSESETQGMETNQEQVTTEPVVFKAVA